MCNIGIACLEELDSLDDIVGGNNSKKTTIKKATPAKAKPAAVKKETVEKKSEPAKESTSSKTSNKKTQAAKPDKKAKTKESKDTKPKHEMPPFSEAQKRAIYNLSRRRGISVEDLDSIVMEDYATTLDNLSSADASDLIRSLQQAA